MDDQKGVLLMEHTSRIEYERDRASEFHKWESILMWHPLKTRRDASSEFTYTLTRNLFGRHVGRVQRRECLIVRSTLCRRTGHVRRWTRGGQRGYRTTEQALALQKYY